MTETLEKEKIVTERMKLEHLQKMEREVQRHMNIMEELELMAKNGITQFQRYLPDRQVKK